MSEHKIFEDYLDRIAADDIDMTDVTIAEEEHVPEIGEYDFTVIIYTNYHNMSALPDNRFVDYTVPVVKRYKQFIDKFPVIEEYSQIYFLYNGLYTTLSRETEKEYYFKESTFLMQFGFNGQFETFCQVFSFISGIYYATKGIANSLKIVKREKEDYIFIGSVVGKVADIEKTYYPQMKKAKEWPEKFTNLMQYANFMISGGKNRVKIYPDICKYFDYDNADVIMKTAKSKDHYMMHGASKELKFTKNVASRLKNCPIDTSLLYVDNPESEKLKACEFLVVHPWDPKSPSTISNAGSYAKYASEQIDPNHINRYIAYYNVCMFCFCIYLGVVDDKKGNAYEVAFRLYNLSSDVRSIVNKLNLLYKGMLPVEELTEQLEKKLLK